MGRPSCVAPVIVVLVLVLASAALGWAQEPPSFARPPDPASDGAVGASAVAVEVQAVRDQLNQLREESAAIRRQYDEPLLALEQRLRQITGGPPVFDAPGAEARVSMAPVSASVLQDPAPASVQSSAVSVRPWRSGQQKDWCLRHS